MLMMAALTILTINVFAQSNSNKSQQEQFTNSKKELMKMEVMKIQISPKDFVTSGAVNNSIVSNLSAKEQMKTSVIKLNTGVQNYTVAVNKSGMCAACLTLSNLSAKEQMKMTAMALDKCPMNAGTPGHEAKKCAICGMDLATSK
jgi:hypothetical protein